MLVTLDPVYVTFLSKVLASDRRAADMTLDMTFVVRRCHSRLVQDFVKMGAQLTPNDCDHHALQVPCVRQNEYQPLNSGRK